METEGKDTVPRTVLLPKYMNTEYTKAKETIKIKIEQKKGGRHYKQTHNQENTLWKDWDGSAGSQKDLSNY